MLERCYNLQIMPSQNTVAWICYAVAILLALRRSRVFGIFVGVVLSLPLLGGNLLRPSLERLGPCVLYVQVAAACHFSSLALWSNMRPLWFRSLISIPGLWWVAVCFMAWPLMLFALFGWFSSLVWLPLALACVGVIQTLRGKEEVLSLQLNDNIDVGELKRCVGVEPGEPPLGARGLKIVQITDPHLGPFMSVARLKRICTRAVEREPDFILLTGDLMTMESQDVDVVTEALSPLRDAKGKVFACHGNHDLEARAVVSESFNRLGITLLIDEVAQVDTPLGDVEIVGVDFVWKKRKEHMDSVFQKLSHSRDAFRLVLLHDPGGFKHVPNGACDLVLSGHTHGGQVGLLSLGLKTTFLSLVSKIPDHGLWGRGKDRLYVHRAQGVYGFPLRIGVPSEQSLMHIVF